MRFALLPLAVLSCSACFQMTTVLKVNGDGSGTIEHRMLYTTAAVAQIRRIAAFGGGRVPFDPSSEQQAREMAAVIGPGVAYLSSTPITTETQQGRESTYTFTDVGQLRIATHPAVPGGVNVRAQGIDTESSAITFSLSRSEGGNAVLRIHVPEPNFLDALGPGSAVNQIAALKQMLAGARVLLAAEPAGAVVRTSSPFVDGSRVTLLEIDLDQILKDETFIPRLQAATTQDEIRTAILEAKGLKINLDREITIEFTPPAK